VLDKWYRPLSPLVSHPLGLTIILFTYPDLTVGARLCRAFGALGNLAGEFSRNLGNGECRYRCLTSHLNQLWTYHFFFPLDPMANKR
jgi:hypothetical protein